MRHANMTVAATLWPTSAGSRLLRQAVLVLAGSLILALSSKVQVPFWPVPVTLQSLAVLALGAAFGARLAGATLAVYLAEGALGLPVFAGTPEKGIGLAYMMGPTGGYLAGFLLAAMLVGWLAEKGADKHPLRMFAAMLAGAAVIYVPGALWLAGLIGFEKAVTVGMLPFLLGDLIKAALAAAIFPAIWQALGRKG